VELTVTGFLVITVVALSLAVILLWLTRRGPKLTADVVEARRSVSNVRRILVPIRGFIFEERAVELACRLGEDQKSEIVLAYVLEVPLTLSLGTPMPEEEEKARQALERSANLVRAHRLTPLERVERDRDAGRGILKVAKDLEVDLVVVGLDPNRGLAIQPIGPTTETLLRRADIEVIVDRPPAPKFE
jgi:nucleotide-binding universal stress UspA family protein